MEWARQLEINVETGKSGGLFKEGFERYIKPVLMQDGMKAKLGGRRTRGLNASFGFVFLFVVLGLQH